MLCRVLLAAIALSYLVCVLFLSGIQKEDLEVGLLKKMEHYNIIYDINNQELHKECLNNADNKADSDSKTTEKEATTTTTTSTPTTHVTVLDTKELQSVLKYLKHRKKIRNPPTTDSTTLRTSENTERPKHLFETLMSEYNETISKPRDSPEIGKKDSTLEDLNKYLQPFTKKLDQLISQTSKKNTNVTSIDQVPLKDENATKESVKKDIDPNVFKNIEQIGKALAELLSKKNIVTAVTTTVQSFTTETGKKVTEKPQTPQDIEQKFVLGIAAINKLNENIANLQKNINGAKSEESKNKFTDQIDKQKQIENFTNQFLNGSDQIHQTINTMYVPKVTEIEKQADYQNANENFEDNVRVQSDNVQNSQSIFYSSWDTLPTKYNMSNFFDSLFVAKHNLNQPTYKLNYMGAPSYGDDIKSDKDMDQNSQKIKSSNYEKEIHSESPSLEQNVRVDANGPMVFLPPQILPNVINYGHYNTKQPSNNNIHNFQYNTDAVENGAIQGKNQDTSPYNSNSKIIQDAIYVPVVKNNAYISNKKSQIQYSDAKQLLQESIHSDFAKQTGLNTYSIQKGKDTLHGYYDSQKGIDSHILNFKERLFNSDIMNKGFDDQEPKRDPTDSLPSEMISKLAEAVKEKVWKDIKKTMTSNIFSTALPPTTTTPSITTPATTSTTPVTMTTTTATHMTTTFSSSALTTSEPTIPTAPTCTATLVKTSTDTANGDLANKLRKAVENKDQVNKQTIEKFIQLFEQMKSAQQISIKSNEKINKLQENQNLKTRYNVPVVMYAPPMSPYGMRAPKQLPIIVHNYVPPIQAGPIFPPSFGPRLDTKNSISPINLQQNYIQPRFPHAVMIQSNEHEIKPIGIPLLRPELMNMNIIVTTQNPFWSRDPNDRWNYINKYGRKPDKKDDFSKLTNSFNVYSKDNVNNIAPANSNPIENNALSKNTAQGLNNSNLSVDDYMKMMFFQQLDSLNKQVNAEKKRNEENVNKIILEKNIFPSKKQFNDSNFQDFINQMAKINQQMFGVPYNNPIYSRYKISNINPNIMFKQLQNGGFSNQPFSYNAPDSNTFNQNIKIPSSVQYGNNREKNGAGQNEINNFNVALGKPLMKPIINEQVNDLIEVCKNVYEKPNSGSQLLNVEIIKNYCNQIKLYHTANKDSFKEMPSYRVKYSDNSRPTFKYQIQNRPKYNSEIIVSSDDNKAAFRNLEKYLDSPNRMDAVNMRQKALLNQASDYTKPLYQHSQLDNDFRQSSNPLDKIKMKYENPIKYYSSPSDEDSNREFKNFKPVVRVYQGVNTNTRLELASNRGKHNGNLGRSHQQEIDLIKAVLGKKNRQKENRERVHSFDTSDTNSQSVDTKGRTILVESSDSDKYASSGRGFREKLESSDIWTEQSDCGPNEHCVSSIKILPRQQMPLDSKKSKYDDARFKKFLQTQEKVNHMLEMILASKPDDRHDKFGVEDV